MRREFSCWQTRQNTGPKIGRIDVVGVRDLGGDLSARSEIIAIEVKRGNQPFATSAGQAHGYSVMAERCYLADQRVTRPAFTDTEKLIAGRLGIGLISIGPKFKITEVVTAPPNEPIEELRRQVIERLGLSTCSLCSIVFARSSDSSTPDYSGVVFQRSRRGALARAAAEQKSYGWWMYNASYKRDKSARELTAWRRYLCPDCVGNVFGHLTTD